MVVHQKERAKTEPPPRGGNTDIRHLNKKLENHEKMEYEEEMAESYNQ